MIEQRAFSFPFEDEDWSSKFVIGTLFYLIAPFFLGIPLLIPQGYALRVWREAVAGRSPHLSAWDDWGEMGLKGLFYYLIIFVYSIPVWLLGLVTFAIALGGGLGLAAMANSLESSEAAAAWLAAGGLLLAGSLTLVTLLMLVVGFVVGLLYPVGIGRYLHTGRLGAAFEFGAVWRAVRANLGGLLVAWLIVALLSLVLVGIVSILGAVPCLGSLLVYLFMAPVLFYLSLVQAQLMGQAYAEAQRRLSGAAYAAVEMSPAAPAAAAPQPVRARAREAAKAPVSIETLALSGRVLRTLHDAGLTTVDQLLARLAQGDEALLSIRGLGNKALEEIKAQLAAHGFLDAP